MAYTFFRTITIDHTQVPNTDQTNFPVLVFISDPTFKTAGNGGHIQNTVTQTGGNAVTMPADMVFTADSGGSSFLPWEIESYDGTNGILWVWVQIPTVSTSIDTVFYVFYDDVTVTTQQNTGGFSPANVWDSNYLGVWHLPNGTTLFTSDSTSHGNNGTNTGFTAIASQVDGGGNSNGSSGNGIQSGSSDFNFTSSPFTISYWANFTSLTTGVGGQGPVSIYKGAFENAGYYEQIEPDGTMYFATNQSGAVQASATNAGAITTGAWYQITNVRNGASVKLYINGIDATTSSATHINPDSSGENFALGFYIDNPGVATNGTLDELEISNIARPADWIDTEYNNQFQPNVFSTLGSETPVTPPTASVNLTRLMLLGVGL